MKVYSTDGVTRTSYKIIIREWHSNDMTNYDTISYSLVSFHVTFSIIDYQLDVKFAFRRLLAITQPLQNSSVR